MLRSQYTELKKQAIKLRKKGLSYSEIKREIDVSKSTLSFWLKAIPLTTGQKKRLYTKKNFIFSKRITKPKGTEEKRNNRNY